MLRWDRQFAILRSVATVEKTRKDGKEDGGLGTLGGVAAFLVGGIGTIVAAIGDFGSDEGALAAARRNHVTLLILAAVCASAGLVFGALYTVIQGSRAGWPRLVLVLGVLSIGAGVAFGVAATTQREPGRPTVDVDRVDESSIQVRITADGLPSNTWYEAIIEGFSYTDPGVRAKLAVARFSPGQDGRLVWSQRMALPKTVPGRVGARGGTSNGMEITGVLIRVQRDTVAAETDCNKTVSTTCMAIRVPPTPVTPSPGQ